MSKHTGKRQAALERKATQHQEFVGSADVDRAESEFREHERIERDRARRSNGSVGPEVPFRLPRPEELRKRARERLDKLPEPAQRVLHVAESAMQLALLPWRIGFGLAREVLKLPLSMLRSREA